MYLGGSVEIILILIRMRSLGTADCVITVIAMSTMHHSESDYCIVLRK